jgi:uncharacterized protein YkwD
MLRFLTLTILFGALLIGSSPAQDFSRVPATDLPEATRLFKQYRESPVGTARVDAMKALLNMHPTVMLAISPIVERDWSLTVTNYRTTLQRQAEHVGRKRASDPAFQKEVSTHRTTLAKLRAKGGNLGKDELKDQGLPALNRLRELFTIKMEDLTATMPALGTMREAAIALTQCRSLLKQKTVLKNDRTYTEEDLKNEEQATFARAFRTDQRVEQVLAMNAEITAKGAVPADEAEGIRDLNAMRILMGLAPVLIDPKLHNAARDHSKDMVEQKFFAHDSPVPGKKTPWDRAKRAGTTASSENIYAGSTSPSAANMAWFLSPGHHVNMFGNARRGGMGRHEGSWTQLFGG